MKKLRLFPVVGMIVGLLTVARVYSEDGVSIDIDKMDAARALLDKYSFLAQPYSFHYFHNMDTLGFHLDWVRGAPLVFPLKEPKESFATDYTFRGERRPLDEYFKRNFVLGFLVLHEDQIVLERYFHNSGQKSRFISFSVAKSIVSILVGIAVEEGKIKSVNDPVTQYLPYLADSGFKDVTVKNLLQMATGIQWNENYLDPKSDFNRYLVAQLRGEPSFAELAASCRSVELPGARFEYQSINTQVLGLLLEAATGMPLNKYCEEKLWLKVGPDSDAFFFRDEKQPQIPAVGFFCATLRDYARFGLMVMNGGILGDRRVVPEAWIRKSTTPAGASEQPQSAGADDEFSENMGYAYQWWLLNSGEGVFLALGVYGQAIYVNPARRVVIVQSSAWPEPDPDEYWDEMIKVMTTITDLVSPPTGFTGEMWEENYPFYQKILNLPFNRELLSGDLDEDIFKRYIIQDYLFLQNYRKVYGILLAKAPDESAMKFIVNLINGIDEEIESIHDKYIDKFNISREELLNSSPYPNTEFYNSFLIKTATIEPFEVGVIATLPCHWIYYQLGVDMKRSENAGGDRYRKWIDGYAEPSWETSQTKQVVDSVENLMRESSAQTRDKIKRAFATAMKLEYMFWDGIYRGDRWMD